MHTPWPITVLAAGMIGCLSVPADDCPAGTAGCECQPGQMCQSALECRPPGVCVDPECVAGTQSCPCDAGQCLTPLTCHPDLMLCTESPEETSTATPTTSADGSGTTMPSVSTGGATSLSTATMSSDSGSADSMTTGNSACAQCIEDNLTDAGACGVEAQTCLQDPQCGELLACVIDCGMDPDHETCFAVCCVNFGPAPQWQPVADCVGQTCPGVCEHVALDPTCSQ